MLYRISYLIPTTADEGGIIVLICFYPFVSEKDLQIHLSEPKAQTPKNGRWEVVPMKHEKEAKSLCAGCGPGICRVWRTVRLFLQMAPSP